MFITHTFLHFLFTGYFLISFSIMSLLLIMVQCQDFLYSCVIPHFMFKIYCITNSYKIELPGWRKKLILNKNLSMSF